jgi:Mrp family chromosome partitioning ATPase
VYLITSTTPGEGKTSIAVSLGLSFAATGSRTLVIDCDLVAQRITRGFNQVGQPGLRDALAAGTVRGFVKKTASGMWVTPVGTADVLDACAVSSTDMKRLLADARRYFDTVIIDSGPILGSVEATTVAPQADGIIFTVSRGQQPTLVDKALKHIESLGAPIAGFVFNRAQAKDFSRSAHASSLRSIPSSSIPTRSLVTDSESCRMFGPLVQSVVSLLPASRQFAEPSGEGDDGRTPSGAYVDATTSVAV